jgi:hypothetical protein
MADFNGAGTTISSADVDLSATGSTSGSTTSPPPGASSTTTDASGATTTTTTSADGHSVTQTSTGADVDLGASETGGHADASSVDDAHADVFTGDPAHDAEVFQHDFDTATEAYSHE